MTTQFSSAVAFLCSDDRSVHFSIISISPVNSLIWQLLWAVFNGSFGTESTKLIIARSIFPACLRVVDVLITPFIPSDHQDF